MIKIFIGPNTYFNDNLPKNQNVNYIYDIFPILEGNVSHGTCKNMENLIIYNEDYSRLSDSGMNAFISIIKQIDPKNIYIHNPPQIIINQLKQHYHNEVTIEYFSYPQFKIEHLKELKKEFNNKILGQEKVKEKLLPQLYKLAKGYNNHKPVIILLYGPSGVGKTETAKYLAEIMKENLLRIQFSMHQNEYSYSYIFGGNHIIQSLGKDLINRESNIILFDEFDKVSSNIYSAFYQLFDEGVFIDPTYTVKLTNSVIICTSNYLNLSDIKKNLGEPIYNRFDSCIKYNEIDKRIIEYVIKEKLKKIYEKLTDEEKSIIDISKCEENITKYSYKFKNIREIDKIIEEYIYLRIVEKI